MKKRNVEEDVVREILKNCNFNLFQRVVVRIFYKEFIEFYHLSRVKIINILK